MLRQPLAFTDRVLMLHAMYRSKSNYSETTSDLKTKCFTTLFMTICHIYFLIDKASNIVEKMYLGTCWTYSKETDNVEQCEVDTIVTARLKERQCGEDTH